jgi:hypothetical protein
MAQHTNKSQLDIYSKDSKFVTEFTDKNGQIYHVNGVFPPIDLHRHSPILRAAIPATLMTPAHSLMHSYKHTPISDYYVGLRG